MLDSLETRARRVAPAVSHWAVRGVVEHTQTDTVRQNIAQAPQLGRDAGVMVTVVDEGGLGYAATSDASESGLARAFAAARDLARASAGRLVFDPSTLAQVTSSGQYSGAVSEPVGTLDPAGRVALLADVSSSTAIDPRIIDWSASLWTTQTEQLFFNSEGARTEQRWSLVVPSIQATAVVNGVSQTRSSAGQYNGLCRQGGLEVLAHSGFAQDGPRVAREALELALAPPCPTGDMELILMPDQMMLQIHESIGHPLELDRILGDERNFAGTSFVTLDMFGNYRYGSDLLNVTYDPSRTEQVASFAFDDDGHPSQRQFLIRDGILLAPLGGAISQGRAAALGHSFEAVATARACSWNRAPIDRMSNLNVEAGASTLDEIIASIEFGVLMRTNVSWSIDDSRNKFQFGCEWGQVVRNGRLAEVVRNPNYRGISATFWRSLSMVGDASTFEVLGTPFCGKGEPSQVIPVGHASPACKFSGVAVFGSAQ